MPGGQKYPSAVITRDAITGAVGSRSPGCDRVAERLVPAGRARTVVVAQEPDRVIVSRTSHGDLVQQRADAGMARRHQQRVQFQVTGQLRVILVGDDEERGTRGRLRPALQQAGHVPRPAPGRADHQQT